MVNRLLSKYITICNSAYSQHSLETAFLSLLHISAFLCRVHYCLNVRRLTQVIIHGLNDYCKYMGDIYKLSYSNTDPKRLTLLLFPKCSEYTDILQLYNMWVNHFAYQKIPLQHVVLNSENSIQVDLTCLNYFKTTDISPCKYVQ